MTKKLEEEFNLPPLDDITPEEVEEKDLDAEELKQEIAVVSDTMAVSDRVDMALPVVQGLDQLEREMDEYADKAMGTFEDLVDLGKNVEDRHAAPIFDSASKMISAALQAKQAKIDKKLKMLELQQRQAKLELEQRKLEHNISKDSDDPAEEIEGKFLSDRTTLLNDLMTKMQENDK